MPASRTAHTQRTTASNARQPAAADTGSRPAVTRCQQCGGVSTTTGTICGQCTQGLLAGQSAFPHRCEQRGTPAGIAGRYLLAVPARGPLGGPRGRPELPRKELNRP